MECHVLSWGRSVPRPFAPVRRSFARHRNSFPSMVPDARLPEERASLAHNARARFAAARVGARVREAAGGTPAGASWNVMMCHVSVMEGRRGAFCRQLRFRAHVEGFRFFSPPAATAVLDPGYPEQVRARSGVTVGGGRVLRPFAPVRERFARHRSPFHPWSRTPRCRRSVPLPRIMRARLAAARVRPRPRGGAGASLAASAAVSSGSGTGCGHACLLRGQGRDGVSLFRA